MDATKSSLQCLHDTIDERSKSPDKRTRDRNASRAKAVHKYQPQLKKYIDAVEADMEIYAQEARKNATVNWEDPNGGSTGGGILGRYLGFKSKKERLVSQIKDNSDRAWSTIQKMEKL